MDHSTPLHSSSLHSGSRWEPGAPQAAPLPARRAAPTRHREPASRRRRLLLVSFLVGVVALGGTGIAVAATGPDGGPSATLQVTDARPDAGRGIDGPRDSDGPFG